MKRRFVLLGTIALFVTVFSAHYGEAAEVVKIGVIGPMTGGLAYFGTNWKMGVADVQLGWSEPGEIEGAGSRISLETVGYDDENKVEKAVAGVATGCLRSVPAIMGPLASGMALAGLV